MKNRVQKFPNKLAEYRKQHGYRQEDVARLLGFTSTERISLWEQGRAMPHVVNLFKLAKLYKVLPHELYRKLYENLEPDTVLPLCTSSD